MTKAAQRTPTTTSYALLGLLAIQSWTTYELAQQMGRGMGKFWPRARSHVYEEPKRLVALGWASATKERVGRRGRTVYAITPEGRSALRAWLGEVGEPPSLEWEQLVKVFFAEHGTKADLLAQLDAAVAWSAEQRDHHRSRARSYLDGEGPFPERMAVHGLVGGFLAELAATVGDWAAHARAVVEGWPDDITDAEPDLGLFAEIAERGRWTALLGDPGR